MKFMYTNTVNICYKTTSQGTILSWKHAQLRKLETNVILTLIGPNINDVPRMIYAQYTEGVLRFLILQNY